MNKYQTIAGLLLLTTPLMAQRLSDQRQPQQLRELPALQFNQASSRTVQQFGMEAPRQAVAVQAADASDYAGRHFYGALINTTEWANMSSLDVPFGIYCLPIGSNGSSEAKLTSYLYDFFSSAQIRGAHYGISATSVFGALTGSRNVLLDTQLWQEQRLQQHDTEEHTYALIASVMAYDPTSDLLYGFQYKDDLTGLNWVTIDPQTDQMEVIAAYRGKTNVLTLASDLAGQMYYIDAVGDLYTVNKSNCRTSLVGNTGVTPALYNQAMTWDGRTGTLLWAAVLPNGCALYSVNPETGEAALIRNLSHDEQFAGIYIAESEARDQAPAAVGRPRLTYADNGSLQGTIAFSVPSKSYDGQTSLSAMNLNVWLDGENLKGEEVQAGQQVSIPVELAEGNHYIAITVDNEQGYSPLRYIYQYAGFDTPLAPAEVTFEQTDGKNLVSWNAPEAGVNSGYIDAASLTYNVVRMPDSVLVATDLKETSFTEVTPGDMHNYFYYITAVNHGHESAIGESNHIICGDAFTVPYFQEFADKNTLIDFYTVVDADGDGLTWRQGYTTEVRMDVYGSMKCDDWLITPLIQLEAGNKYRYYMEMKSFVESSPEDFQILIGTDKSDLSSFTLIKEEQQFTRIAKEFANYTCDFNCTTSGNYYLALRMMSQAEKGGALMMIRNIGVDLIGRSLAPAQCSDLSIVADASDAQQATLTFTTPTLDLMDQPITTLSRVCIYRSGDLVQPAYILQSPEVGKSYSWTDEAVPTVGINTYLLVAENEHGAGESLEGEQFVGCYTAPWTEDFSDKRYFKYYTLEGNYDFPSDWEGWKWADGKLTFTTYQQQPVSTDCWFITPGIRLDQNSVYSLSYDAQKSWTLYPDESANFYLGTSPTQSAMTQHIAEMPDTEYKVKNCSHYIITTDAGKFYLGLNCHAENQYSYMDMNLDNLSITYLKSAFCPYAVTGLKVLPNQQGEIEASLSFRTPTVNYQNNALASDEELTVSIYRGQSTIPAYTTQALPGTDLQWTDKGCIHGSNTYTIVCSNQYGRGEQVQETLWIGRDTPLYPAIAFHGSADNKDAVLTWQTPTVGINGGVVIADELTYNVYSYNPTTTELTPIQDEIKGNSYTIVRDQQTSQQLHYYAVSAVNTEGESQANAASIVLGELYNLPFNESFANGQNHTDLWQVASVNTQAVAWGYTNPGYNSYNGCTGAQDKDKGSAYMYNGYQYDTWTGALLVSPKIKLSQETGNELTFWTWNFLDAYSTFATVQVALSADDSQYSYITQAIEVGGTTESGWTKHTVNLDQWRSSNFISLAFMGITMGYQDVIYMDNITVSNTQSSGISELHADDTLLPAFDLMGRHQPTTQSGDIIIRNGKKLLVK